MTTMYDEPRVFDGGPMKAFPHMESGVERGRAKDPVKYLQAVEQRARERQVAYETIKILRTRVIECYRREGVNHYDNCKEPVQEYYNLIVRNDLGQLQPNWSNAEKNDGWHGGVAPQYHQPKSSTSTRNSMGNSLGKLKRCKSCSMTLDQRIIMFFL